MRPVAVASALALAIVLAGCTAPAGDVEPASTNASLGEGVAVVGRASTSASGSSSTAGNGTTLADDPDLGAPDPTSLAPRRVPFGLPVELDLVGGLGAGEPNIAALSDGTLFTTSPTGSAPPNAMQGGGYLWRSTDAGATWETLRAPEGTGTGAFCSCDSDVVTSPDGWVYYSDWWISGLGLGPGNYLVERSSDGGDTWASTSITSREALNLHSSVDRQWLVAGEDGFVGLFYSHFARANSPVVADLIPLTDLRSGVHAVFSTDHGETWGDPVVVLDGGSWQIAHPRITPEGALVMPYGSVPDAQEFWRDPSLVMLAVSTDAGRSWEHVQVAEAPEGFDNLWAVQADVDATGAIHVGWAARVDDETMATYVSTSRDLGLTWTEPLALRTDGLNFLPWVAATGNGTVAVGWYGGDATGDPAEADAPWYAYVAESRDGGETFAVHRVWDEPVKEGALCPRGAACEGDRELLDYVSMVYDAQGSLHYAFARSEEGSAVTMVASALAEASP